MAGERLPMRTKLGFGAGSIAEAAIMIAFNTWNTLFYNNVLGLPGKLCGFAVAIALVIDAISDPIVGSISDRVRSKLGRRHPFLYAAPIPLAITFVLIYMPPAGLGNMGLFLWFTFFAVLQRQALTLYQVPHLALGAELSDDYRERSIVMSYNTIFAVVGGSLTFFYGWTWFGKIQGGTAVRDGYPGMAIGVGAIAAVAIFLSAYATHDRIPYLRKPRADIPRFSLLELLREIRMCFRNHNYTTLLIGLILLSVTVGTRETLNSYSSLFFWELPEARIRLFGLASPPAFIIGFFLTVKLHDWIDKRATLIIAMCTVATASGLPVLLRIIGVMPLNGSPNLLRVLMLFVFLFYTGVAILTITLLSSLADITDEHELETGLRQEGIFFASRTFFAKLTTGLGHVLAGFVLDIIAFPTGAKPGQVAHDVVTKLALFEGPCSAVFGFAAAIFYARYRIDRARHDEIRRGLAERRARSVPPGAEPQQAHRIEPEPAAG